jgi:signal peptidase I
MLPTISAGSEVRVVARTRPPRIAEIWAFCDSNGTVVVHRYWRRDDVGRSVFRGDNMRAFDEPVSAELLIGLVTSVRRGGTEHRFAMQQRLWWFVTRLNRRLRRYSRFRPFRRRT